MVTGSHLPKILILKLWPPGGQEMLIERHFSVKCTNILKIITRNGLEKRAKMKNMMNSLNKRKKIQERIQAPTYAAEVLGPFSYFYNDSTKHQHHQQALAKKAWRKINTSTLSATAIASASLASMSTGILIDIEQTLPILHSGQPSAENFYCFSGQNAQSNFLQQRAPLESSISVSRKRRYMVCFNSRREDRMYACAGRGRRATCQFT